jgi:protein-tyrosine phosphatase
MFNGASIEAKSAGTSEGYSNHVTSELIEWAEVIFVMEEKHKQYLIEVDASSAQKILVLDIPDIFGKNQPELQQLLLDKMQPYLEKLNAE